VINVCITIGILAGKRGSCVPRVGAFGQREEYVDAARASGASTWRVMLRHVTPNAIAPMIVYTTMGVGGAILTEAALSFLGHAAYPWVSPLGVAC